MRGFLGDLGDRLAVIADEHTVPALVAEPPPAAPRRRRRGLIAGAVAVVVTTAGAAFALTGTSLAGLPILSSPTTDASHLSTTPALDKPGIDFSEAHVFGTPAGPGYVVTNPSNHTICMAVPDLATPGSYGGRCATLGTVEREGLMTTLVGDRSTNPAASTLVAFILPEHAKRVRVRTGGQTTSPQIESGVMTTELRSTSEVTWTVRGHRHRQTVLGPFQDTSLVLECADGRQVNVPMPTSSDAPSLARAKTKACR